MPHFGGFCPEMHFWAELGPKRRSANAQASRIGDLGFVWPRISNFHENCENSWNFMKFHEMSRNFRKGAPPGRPKVKRLIWRYTGGHSGWWFLPQKCKFSWFSWKKWNFHEFHEISQFSQKTALFAPKCTLGHLGSQNHQYSLSYGRNSASGRKSALFREKSHFLLIFTLFAKITFFMIFMIFMKNMNFRIMQDKQGRKSAKKCNFMIFMKFPWKSQKIREFSEFPEILTK